MSTTAAIASRHLDAALAEATAAGLDKDALYPAMLGHVVSKYLEYRSVKDVQSELHFLADNCDPDTDFEFMRP